MKLSEALKPVIYQHAEEKHYFNSGEFINNCNFVLDGLAPLVAMDFFKWTLSGECDYFPGLDGESFVNEIDFLEGKENPRMLSLEEVFNLFVNKFYKED